MTALTRIGWTDATWNPTRGCSRVSPGCMHCYAEREAWRGNGGAYQGLVKKGTGDRPVWTGDLRLVPKNVPWPLRWRGAAVARSGGRPSRVFVNSMSDLGHEGVPDTWRDSILAVMALTGRRITYQVLTKRAANMRRYLNDPMTPRRVLAAMAKPVPGAETPTPLWRLAALPGCPDELPGWPLPMLHYGVSVENQATADERLQELAVTHASTRIVSYEPALEAVDFTRWMNPYRAIDWLIIGGESGPGARRFCLEWAAGALELAATWGVPVFFKQLGALPYAHRSWWGLAPGEDRESQPAHLPWPKNSAKGDDPSDWPPELQVQQFPPPVNPAAGLRYLPMRDQVGAVVESRFGT